MFTYFPIQHGRKSGYRKVEQVKHRTGVEKRIELIIQRGALRFHGSFYQYPLPVHSTRLLRWKRTMRALPPPTLLVPQVLIRLPVLAILS